MMTAMLCVENIVAGRPVYDLWRVNQDAEYHEAGSAGEQVTPGGLRLVPTSIANERAQPKADVTAVGAAGATTT